MPSAVLPPVFSFSVIFSIQYRDDNISSDQLEADLSDCVSTFLVGEINDRFKLMCDVMRNDCPYIVQVASSLYKFSKLSIIDSNSFFLNDLTKQIIH
jgi:hypothetical protein